jgi:(1->4)-alpha-D-glucan 1-alpha-D-glucosylmutase
MAQSTTAFMRVQLKSRASDGTITITTFKQLQEMIPYYKEIGISTLYLSPIFLAGDYHGYNTLDYNQIDPEIGTIENLRELVDALKSAGMQAPIIDFVPNHMGLTDARNVWAQDVLRSGRESAFAKYFDIDYDAFKRENHEVYLLDPEIRAAAIRLAPEGEYINDSERASAGLSRLQNKMVLPFLGGTLQEALQNFDAGRYHLEVRYDATHGPHFDYWGNIFPIDPASVPLAMSMSGADTPEAITAYFNTQRDDEKLGQLNALLNEQHYVLMQWYEGRNMLNYRRFFNVKELIGVRQDVPEVREASHALVWQLAQEELISGIRNDHVDGLSDPLILLRYQREKANALGLPNFAIYIEKILERDHESLAPGFIPLIQGTTGYELYAATAALFVLNHEKMVGIYERFTGESVNVASMRREARTFMIETEFQPEHLWLTRLLRDALTPAQQARHSIEELHQAIKSMIVEFDVYRTYNSQGNPSRPAGEIFKTVVEKATVRNPEYEELFTLIKNICLLTLPNAAQEEFSRRFQQQTGPTVATGDENTLLYRMPAILALGEVGQNIARPLDAGEFISTMSSMRNSFPRSMHARSTHDTKWGEDALANLCGLTHVPDRWEEFLLAIQSTLSLDDCPIHKTDQYRVLQAMVATLPLDEAEISKYRQRLHGFIEKSLREAKVHSHWIPVNGVAPNPNYENSTKAFADSVLDNPQTKHLLKVFAESVQRIGQQVTLAMEAARFAAGVPDCYDTGVAFMDPDNRRPIDYQKKYTKLVESRTLSLEELVDNWPDGTLKQRLVALFNEQRARNENIAFSSKITRLPVNDTRTGQRTDKAIAFCIENMLDDASIIVTLGRNFDQSFNNQTHLGLGEEAQHFEVDLSNTANHNGIVYDLTREQIIGDAGLTSTLSLSDKLHTLPVSTIEIRQTPLFCALENQKLASSR